MSYTQQTGEYYSTVNHVKSAHIDLNCDVGESFGHYTIGNDEALMPLVSSVNIACGFHGGDPSVMRRTLALAVKHGVAVGAHPGFADLQGFGRRDMHVSEQEVFDMVAYQIGALQAFAQIEGTTLTHVKPHGALYNTAAQDTERGIAYADAIARAVKAVNPELILVGLAHSTLTQAGKLHGLRVAHEGFCDRTYQADGSLTERAKPNAVHIKAHSAAAQAVAIAKHRTVLTMQGKYLALEADTLCIHGDTPQATAFAQAIRAALEAAEILIKPLAKTLIALMLWCGSLLMQSTPKAQAQDRWTLVGSPPPRVSSIVDVPIMPRAAATLLCSTPTGLYASSDSGLTWTHRANAPEGRLARTSTGTLILFGNTIHVSRDGGTTWQRGLLRAAPEEPSLRNRFKPDFTTLVAPLHTQATTQLIAMLDERGVMRSTNDGQTFFTAKLSADERSAVLAFRECLNTATLGRFRFTGTQTGVQRTELSATTAATTTVQILRQGLHSSVGQVRVFPVPNSRASVLISDSWRSRDGGATWQRIVAPAEDAPRTTILAPSAASRDGTLFAATTTNVLRSTNGAVSWQMVNLRMPPNAVVYHEPVIDNAHTERREPRSEVMQPLVLPNGTILVFLADTSSVPSPVLRPRYVASSQDNGTTWRVDTVQNLDATVGLARFVAGRGSRLYAVDGAFLRPVLYRSDNGGRTWRALAGLGRFPLALAVNPFDGSLYAVFRAAVGTTFARSTNNGETWERLFFSSSRVPVNGPTNLRTPPVFAFSHTATTLFVRDVGVFRQVQEGFPFVDAHAGLDQTGAFSIAAGPDETTFALTLRGVYRLERTGTRWRELNTGLPNDLAVKLFPTALAFDSTGNALLSTTRGLYRLGRASITSVQDVENATVAHDTHSTHKTLSHPPLNVMLFPNPVVHECTVRYRLERAAFVRLSICTLTGNELMQQEAGWQAAGEHHLHIHTGNLPAGSYLCRLQTTTQGQLATFSTVSGAISFSVVR